MSFEQTESSAMAHMPAEYREAFSEAWSAFLAWKEGAPPPVIEIRDMPASIDRVCGLLWRCNDTMPYDLFDALGEHAPPGRPLRHLTYASGARLLRLLYQRALLARAKRAVWAAS